MSTTHSVGRSAATQENDRSAVTQKKDRSCLCAFTFADGRQCRTPCRDGHSHLCAFHPSKEAQALAGAEVGQDIAYHLYGSYVSACDLSSTLECLSRLPVGLNSSLANFFRMNTSKTPVRATIYLTNQTG